MRPLKLRHLRLRARTESLSRLALAGTVALVPVVGGTAYAMPNGVVQRVVAPIWDILKSPLDGQDLPSYVVEASLAERRAEEAQYAFLAGLAYPEEGGRPISGSEPAESRRPAGRQRCDADHFRAFH